MFVTNIYGSNRAFGCAILILVNTTVDVTVFPESADYSWYKVEQRAKKKN